MKLSTLITRLSSLATAAFVAATASADPTVGQVLVHQLWPWSQNVKVEYTLSGTDGGAYDVDVSCYEADVEIAASKVRSALCGGEGFHGVKGDGIHTFTLDPSKLVADGATALGNFTVSITVSGPGDPPASRVEYRVFDLETGAVTDLTRGNIYDRPDLYGSTVITNYADVYSGFTKPADLPAEDVFIVPGFNTDEFKTTKLVMKRIPAANVEWYMGPSEGDAYIPSSGWDPDNLRLGEHRFPAKFTSDYYIGIFEVTQKQYAMLMDGSRPSYYTNETYWLTRPVENVSWSEFRTNFIPTAQATLGKAISLPTEAQWEFAAKAMYNGPVFPSGLQLNSEGMNIMEGYSSNRQSGATDRNATISAGTVNVGLGLPNPFGLYNMFGNVSEWMLDLPRKNLATYYNATEENPKTDPYCTAQDLGDDNYRVYKGNSYAFGAGSRSRCAWRGAASKNSIKYPNSEFRTWGIRVVCPAD